MRSDVDDNFGECRFGVGEKHAKRNCCNERNSKNAHVAVREKKKKKKRRKKKEKKRYLVCFKEAQ